MASELSKVEAFAELDEAGLAALEGAAEIKVVRGGDYLVRYGEEADALYLVSTGRFYVQLPNGLVVAEIGAGEPVGELAFFSGGTRTADVRASRDSSVLALTREDYDRIVAQHPKIADGILAAVSGRLARATAFSRAMEAKPATVITMIPAAGTEFPRDFVERIRREIAKDCDTRMLTVEDRPEGLPSDGESFGRWLGEMERSGQRLLLVAGPDERWNKQIARNGDDLVIVAPLYGEECGRSELEDYAIPLFLRANRTLVLWRERREQPINGSLRWLESRNVKLHHHVPLDCDEAFARVGRFLCGRANGVVLAGGGALGCAHIGVMQGMIENGIPIDFYGGTSAGAAMGGAIARGLTPEDTLQQMYDMFIKAKAMKRLTFPVHSILDPRVFDEQLTLRYGEQDIADLPYNFFGVSTNLTTNSVYVHRRGPLWHAVRASGSLPTILPPFITDDGDVLVDGGVLDNVPVKIMRASKAGPNVVVNLRDDAGEEWRLRDTKYSSLRGRWRLFRDIIFRRKPQQEFPSLVDIMSRSMVVTSASTVRQSLDDADVLLVPPIPKTMKILDWHLGTEVSEDARRYVAARIQEQEKLQEMRAA
ncbi:MAG: cyclic nucleotide-binding and patatin-like phospholipase domain-containing protein [Parasphingopyxis sp.]|uniref:cyclic nucleotide-binding and patatin-like phospholipase domain-containing protein n=1 Tax=Parasphingopyxis sp. TaxID=1920299 RepID=UPI0032EE0235